MKKFFFFMFISVIAAKSFAQNPQQARPQAPAAAPTQAQPQAHPQAQPPQQPQAQQPAQAGAPADDFQIPPEMQGAQPGQLGGTTTQTSNPLPPELSDPLLEGFFEDLGYNPADKRDPFLPYLNPAQRLTQGPQAILEPLQKFALAQLKLIGIIWDVGTPKALIEDPSGKSHIIVENTKIGQELGYVAAIREGEIIVVEQQISSEGKKSFTTKIIKLTGIKGT